jgi:hypothetical protein
MRRALLAACCLAAAGGGEASHRTPSVRSGAITPAIRAHGSRTTPAACRRRAALGPGAAVPSSDLGAVHFLTASVGVGLSSAFVWCSVRRRSQIVAENEMAARVWLVVTHDAGRTWRTTGTAPSLGETARGPVAEQVAATSTRAVWVLGSRGRLVWTGDGGASWHSSARAGPEVALAQSAHRIWAAGCAEAVFSCRPTLSRLTLAHGSWQPVGLPRTAAAQGVQLLAPSDAVVVLNVVRYGASGSDLLSTQDAGRHWSARADPRPRWMPGIDCGNLAAAGPENWWLICTNPGGMNQGAQALEHTADAGRAWRAVATISERGPRRRLGAVPTSNPVGLGAGSTADLWWPASVGPLLESRDGGVTWGVAAGVDSGGYQFSSFDVLARDRAWFLTPTVGLWRTTDGAHWRRVRGGQARTSAR